MVNTAKLYNNDAKKFCKKKFCLTFETCEIFNDSRQNLILYKYAVSLSLKNFSYILYIMLTLQYKFNVTRNRYHLFCNKIKESIVNDKTQTNASLCYYIYL